MTTETGAAGSGQPRERLTVLMVEDERLVRELIGELLAAEGYRVLAARDAGEAEDMARREPVVDALVVDARVPGGGGATLVERLRARHPSAGALVVSGADEEAGVRDRGVRFLAKPFTRNQLREALLGALADRPGARAP